MTGKQQLAETIRRVTPITNRLVDELDACPHEAAVLGYLLGLRRGYKNCQWSGIWGRDPEIRDIEDFITEVTEYGLPD